MLKRKIIKNIRFYIFSKVYKKLSRAISVKKNKMITVKKIIFSKKYLYNFYIIPKGRLYSDTVHDTAYILGNEVIIEPSFQYRYKKNFKIINAEIYDNIALKKGTPKIIKRLNGNIFSLLCGGAAKNNYWHWIFDVLPKIGILDKAKIIPNFYLLPSLSKKFQLETFKMLGIEKKIINGEKYNHIFAENIYATDHPIVKKNNPTRSIKYIPAWVIKWLRKKFLKTYSLNNRWPKKIFIDREYDSDIKTRGILNNLDLKNFLKKKGFKIITLSNYSFKNQIQLFNNAKIIIGLHGGGFANIVFSKKNTKIIELQSLKKDDIIKNLAQTCKLKYFRINNKNYSLNSIGHNFIIKANIVKIDKLLKNIS